MFNEVFVRLHRTFSRLEIFIRNHDVKRGIEVDICRFQGGKGERLHGLKNEIIRFKSQWGINPKIAPQTGGSRVCWLVLVLVLVLVLESGRAAKRSAAQRS